MIIAYNIYIITQSVHFSTGFLICRQPVSAAAILSGIGKASIINIWQWYSCSYGKHQPSTCGFLVLGVFLWVLAPFEKRHFIGVNDN